MAQFQYIARNAAGEKITGALEAASEAAAVRALGDKSLFPVRVAEKIDEKAAAGGPRISIRELTAIYEQLADLLRAGVPLLRALETLGRTSSNQRVSQVVGTIAADVAAGHSLEEAMIRQPQAFSQLQTAMIRAGERGGFLEQVLTDMAGYLERQDELRSRVRGAMIYPALLVMVGIGVVTFCLLWMVPKFKPLFKNMPLPLPSRVLFTASDLVNLYWPMTLTGVALVAATVFMFLKTPTGKKLWSFIMLNIPVIGHAIRMVAVTRFCRVLGTMLGSGVPMLQALSISGDAAGLKPLADSVNEAIESVRQGHGLATPLKKSGLIPGNLLEMIAVAEESNQLEKVLLKIAADVERRTNRQVDTAVRLLEPVILVLLAAVILFVALGLLYPIFSMASNIK